jgi:hypothetical protein
VLDRQNILEQMYQKYSMKISFDCTHQLYPTCSRIVREISWWSSLSSATSSTIAIRFYQQLGMMLSALENDVSFVLTVE